MWENRNWRMHSDKYLHRIRNTHVWMQTFGIFLNFVNFILLKLTWQNELVSCFQRFCTCCQLRQWHFSFDPIDFCGYFFEYFTHECSWFMLFTWMIGMWSRNFVEHNQKVGENHFRIGEIKTNIFQDATTSNFYNFKLVWKLSMTSTQLAYWCVKKQYQFSLPLFYSE